MSNPTVALNDAVSVRDPNDVRPFLKVAVYGEDYWGLLDSGSSISILGASVAQRFLGAGVKLHADPITDISTANGARSRVEGFVFLPITREGVTKVIKFYVVPEVSTSVILGVDFWRSFGLAPDVLSQLPLGLNTDPRVAEVHHLHPLDDLTPSQRAVAEGVMSSFEEISFERKGLGRTSVLSHTIDVGDALPIKQRYFCLSPDRLRELNRQLDEMLALGVVEPSSSPWNNPVLLVPKANGELRFCLDSRKLNAVSKGDAYPLPYISGILDQLREAKFLSSIDLKAAFWQIPLDSTASREKTAFTVPGRGLFQFAVMCFGLKGAPATQQRLMDRLFGPEFGSKVFVYLDDIVVASSTFEEHISLLRQVVHRLKSAGLTINLGKSHFFRRELKYLGYVVDERGLHTDPSKVQAIVDYPTPTTRKEVKMFLGTATYYRRFIKDFSTIASPLNALTSTRKSAPPFKWTEETERAFCELKSALVSSPVLACPDFTKPFSIHCDASGYGIAGTLAQVQEDGLEHPIAYASRSLNRAERNYSATEREALAVVFAVEHFRAYVEGGARFKVITDHSSLKWFFNLSNPTGRLARWGCRLSAFNFEIEHRKGIDNIVPDALSRAVPVAETQPILRDPWYDHLFKKCEKFPQSCPNYSIRDAKLFRYSKSKFGLSGDNDWKEVVPYRARQELIRAQHCGELSPHFGIFKTYKRLALRYFWPKLYHDVVKFVNACDTCSAYKHPQLPTPGLMGNPKVCSRPFETISIDLVGPLPRSRAGYTFLLVVVCCFSKYCLLFPLRRALGKTIASRLEEGVFLVHGVPRTVILDNGTNLTGSEVQALFTKYQIPQVHFTPKYCPQVNTVEKYNRFVVQAMSVMVGDDHRAWDLTLPKIQFALNSSVNETTRFTPFFLVHGREAVQCGSVFGESSPLTPITLECSSRDDYAARLGELSNVFKTVSEAMTKAHARSKVYYNKSRRAEEFNVGDTVWRKTFPLSDASKFFTAKLAPRYVKSRVIGKHGPLVYELVDAVSGKPLGRWHMRNLKRN